MRHFIPSDRVVNPRGVVMPAVRVRVRPYGRATFQSGEIVELDQGRSLPVSTSMRVSDESSGYYNATLPTLDGVKWRRAHVIIDENDVPQGRECWGILKGLAEVIGTGANGVAAVVAVEGESNLHGRRVKGIIVDAVGETRSLILWDGVHGFGTLQTPSGGGGSDSDGSDVSDGSDGSDGSGGGGGQDDDTGSEIGGTVGSVE